VVGRSWHIDKGSCKIWEFVEVWSGSCPICNYFSEDEGPTVNFLKLRDCGVICNKLRDLFAKL
jgi:hypothetical protein